MVMIMFASCSFLIWSPVIPLNDLQWRVVIKFCTNLWLHNILNCKHREASGI